MDNEQLKTKITELLPPASFDESGEWLNINIEPTEWLSFARQLRNDESLFFDYLFCLTCIDWQMITNLRVQY